MDWLTSATALGWAQVFMALVTAGATVALWRVTQVLARETKRMADQASQPHVVATIEPNPWAMMYVDLKVANTGNAAAHEVQLEFDPPLSNGKARSDHAIPLQGISVLKPSQSLSSFLCDYENVKGVNFKVSVSWKRSPNAPTRETLTYSYSLGHYEGLSQLENDNPLIQISKHIKHIREDWRNVSTGLKRLRADIFTEADRKAEQQALERRWKREEQQQEKQPRAPRKAKNPGENPAP